MTRASSTTRVRFAGASGGTIAGRLEMPAGAARACAVFAHCFTCSKDLKAVVRISRALAERGIGVLRFDFTGLGESEGEFEDTDFTSNIDDLVAAAEFMRGEVGAPQLLIGHSLGGAAVLVAAARVESAEAVVTIGAPSTTRHLSDSLLRASPELASRDRVEVELGGRHVAVGRELVEDLARRDLSAEIADLGLPLLILHSPVDETVGIEHAAKIYRAARHPKSFVALDGADHLLLARDEDSRFVAEIIAAWSSRYFTDKSSAAEEPSIEDGEVVVASVGDGFTHEIRAPRHRWLADEPASVGGADSGPSPYELLLGGLGACKAMTLRMYANRKGWPLSGVKARLRHGRIHAEACEECESEKGLVDRIEVKLEIEGDLDEAQRARLSEIADRCPVHRTLTTETLIETAVDSGEA